MNFKQIDGFCYLAQTLNFSKAADLLYLSQPAFSRMISMLEDELGCQLFIRSKTDPKLTPAGERIYQHMTVLQREYEDIMGIAKLAKMDRLGSIRIGILDNGLTVKSRNLLVGFQEQYPDVEIILREFSEVEIFHALEMGWIDVAFLVHFPEVFKKNTEGIVTETSRECVIFHKSHPMAELPEVRIADLKNEQFIMLRENKSEMGYNSAMTQCLANGFSPDIVMKADSVAGALSGVACNLGCTILTDSLRYLTEDNVVFVPVKGSKPLSHWMIWKKEIVNSRLHDLIDYTKAVVEQH
ncbi:MAG: LysR family transcriptional regulator [Eubacterium sp.]|nr:LysR family transcriptional regulator [Eubacterium sp.]